ncbi:Naphthalene 1,2-dioxygenase/salicylate 5-hydroxylase systems, ferredoxin component [bioreactor metagenome]|uniref:Naphthalene 1,2-dioxygenase/salicylate 5-hydroxylase systems, ferredoxin component n=1 Tax=bioreactor metagenome TaxID=1076179 RepID=A0A645DIV3_9ZZZZ
MSYTKAASVTDVPEEQCVAVMLDNSEILLAKIDGSYYAVSNKCPHLGGRLSDGILDAGVITCPKHHAKFDLKTGANMGEAKLAFLKIGVKDLKTYPVKVEGDDIWVDLG